LATVFVDGNVGNPKNGDDQFQIRQFQRPRG
jgi:hypothetical protein